MTFIQQPMDDHKEREPVQEATYTLRIGNYKVMYRDDGTAKSLMVIHEIDGEPDAKPVMEFVNLVLPEDSEHSKYWKLAYMKGYMKKFGIDYEATGLDPDTWTGATADINLVQTYLIDGSLVNQFAEREITPVT